MPLLYELPIVADAGQRSRLTGGGTDQISSKPSPGVGVAGASGDGGISAFVRLSEVKFDPPGNDGGDEFVEVQGEPLTSVGSRWLVALEGDLDANPGRVDLAIDLSRCAASSCHFDERGLLLLVTDRRLAPSVAARTRESVELANGALENGTTSLLVLDAPSDLEAGASDWDADDDGHLELPDGWKILDSVSWTDSASDLSYGSTLLGPKPKPQAAWRCRGASGGEFWAHGQLIGDSRSLAIDPDNTIPAGVAGQALTPGTPNECSELASARAAAGARGLAEGSTIGAIASAGMDGGDATGGCSGVCAANAPRGGRSALIETAPSEAGSVTVRVVHAAPHSGLAGMSGWWSPSPFATVPVQAAGDNAGGAHPLAVGRASGGTAVIPSMPSSCAIVPSSARRPVTFAGLGLAVALAAARGRKRVRPLRRGKDMRVDWGNSQMPCAEPAIPLYAPPKNVEPSDLECAPTP